MLNIYIYTVSAIYVCAINEVDTGSIFLDKSYFALYFYFVLLWNAWVITLASPLTAARAVWQHLLFIEHPDWPRRQGGILKVAGSIPGRGCTDLYCARGAETLPMRVGETDS